jgi:hypothetical protein
MKKFQFVYAMAVKNHDDGSYTSIQVPSFYLNTNIQGIVTPEGAKRVAEDIINPTKDPSIEVHVHVMDAPDF